MPNVSQRGRLGERDARIAADYAFGMSQEKLGQKYELSQQHISTILAAIRAEHDATTREDHRASIVARVAEHHRMLRELAEMEGAPVTAGKDGDIVYDPTVTGPDGKPVVVRDYSGRLNAIRTALAVDERLAKLIGTDAPTRSITDMTITDEPNKASDLAAEARAALDEG
jgi:hypothetical protein